MVTISLMVWALFSGGAMAYEEPKEATLIDTVHVTFTRIISRILSWAKFPIADKISLHL